MDTVDSAWRTELGLYPGTTGVAIEYVSSGSPASSAGLRVHDVVESIDHRSILRESAFNDRINGLDDGAQITIGFWRKNAKGKWEREYKIVRID